MENENKTEEAKAGGDTTASTVTAATEKAPENDKKDVAAGVKESSETDAVTEKKTSTGADDEVDDKKADKAAPTTENDDKNAKSESEAGDKKVDDKSSADSGDDKKSVQKDKLTTNEANDTKKDDKDDVTDGEDKKTDGKEKNGTATGGADGVATAPVADKKKATKEQGKEKNDKKVDKNKDDKEEQEDVGDDNKEVDEEEEGVALAEIDRINDNINKTRVDGLQTLHEFCFNTIGKNNVVKKNLRSFAGFEFEKDSSDYKEKLDAIKKTDAKALKGICDILALERKGKNIKELRIKMPKITHI
ncbi:unnamed protein product [Ceratitis capitata]|uniref:(Mediterranean fruit fly) hypothetical protein n=1 Tax=Ceratitis capitata TaxID=7213 RepID=A0A811V9S9_CERCA|nr:unnamed protein product [Ceratitis capitata]